MKNLSKVVLKLLKHKTSSPCLHNTNKEDAEQNPFSMTSCFTSGFTLIELLVVVLIIGILSAVALPQYQTAVLKSRYANMQVLAHTYYKAAQVFKLANGTWPSSFDELDVSLPGGVYENTTPTAAHCGKFTQYYCCLVSDVSDYQSSGVTCGLNDYRLGVDIKDFRNGKEFCFAATDDKPANRVCKSLGGVPTTGGVNMVTPNGHQNSMTKYAF
ncbi:type IV pilin protein [Candidatus Avelusimicrobium sp.]